MHFLLIFQSLLALTAIQAKQVITTPKNSVFTHIPHTGWDKSKVLANNDHEYYDHWGKSLEKALAPLHDEPLNVTYQVEPLDKKTEQYKNVVANGRILTEIIIPTLHDNQKIRILKLQSAHTVGKKNLPAYISVHGGVNLAGTAIGDAERLRNMTNTTDAIFFFVDHRYAPLTKSPGQTEDFYQAIKEVYNNAEKYDIDRHRIAIGGGSTGCTIALGAALMLQKNNEEHMLKQIYLILPSINNIMWTEPNVYDQSKWSDSVKFMFTLLQTQMKLWWTASVKDYEKETRENIYMFPGKASMAQIKKLPPTVVLTAELDFYRIDALEFAKKLQKAGKLLDFGDYGGVDHLFMSDHTPKAVEKYYLINDITKLINTYL